MLPSEPSFESMLRPKSSMAPSDKMVQQIHKLKEELRETKNREEKLIDRLTLIESRDHHDEIKDGTGQVLNKDGESGCFEERFVEQIIHDIIETASKTNAAVPLCEFKRLYKVYLAIKNQNERLRQKYTSAEQDRVFLKQTLLECYKLPSESHKNYLDSRWKERNKIRANYKKKKSMVEKSPSSSDKATSSSNGNDGAFLQNSHLIQTVTSKSDRELSSFSDQPAKINKKRKGVGDVDVVCIGESDNVKSSTAESSSNNRQPCSLEDRAKLTCNRFDWEENTGEKRTFRQYFDELMSYKGIMGDFDILPDHASLGDLGKFVAFVRIEHDKFHKGEESFITVEEIEQLDAVNFEWEDIGIRKLLNRKRRTSSTCGAIRKKRVTVASMTCQSNPEHVEDSNYRAEL